MRLLLVSVLILLAPCAAVSAQEGGTGVRVIAPELIAPPPLDPSDLERIAPRIPPSPPPGQKSQADEAVPLIRPIAIAAGLLEFAGRTVKLDGLRIVPAERICEARDGGTWPCGMHARTAFRLWLRGRTVQCVYADDDQRGEDGVSGAEEARCSVSGEDAAAWLVGQGWGLAEDGGPYVELERQARDFGRGVFSGGPESF